MRSTQRRWAYLLALLAGTMNVHSVAAENEEEWIAKALQRALDRSDYATKRRVAELRDVSDPEWQGLSINRSVEEWVRLLTSDQYRATREKVTDEPFTGEFVGHDEDGIYHCTCGNPLFHSEHKQVSKIGFPSFLRTADPEAIVTDVRSEWSHENEQVELLCGACGAHLGHVDPGERPGDSLIFQVNSSALVFQSANATQLRSESRIVSQHPHFEALVATGTAIELLASGFSWVEGPVWDRKNGYLLFSDIPENAVYRWQAGSDVSLYLKPSGYSGAEPFAGREPGSNGLAIDDRGRLVLCEHGNRRISRLEADGSRTVLIDRFGGKRLNSPNDAVFRSNGDLYFTDPPFGLPGTFDDPGKELAFSGIYRLSADGDVVLLTDELRAPNGVAFSPDESRLYVTDADANRPAWWVYDVGADGGLENGRIFASAKEWTARRPGSPDGIEVDRGGNVFGAGPGGVYVFSPGGVHLGTIDLGVATGNLAWGGDGSDLYITADDSIYRVRTSTRGVGW